MVRAKARFVCQQCGAHFSQWSGRCAECGSWNSLNEEIISPLSHSLGKVASRFQSYAGEKVAEITPLQAIEAKEQIRLSTQLKELDRVLGGGLVAGSVVLIGGDPGVGKSTLLLQTLANLSLQQTLYVTGEESLQQVALRAQQLGLSHAQLYILAETNVESMLAQLTKQSARIVVIDSIQTIYTSLIQAAPGSVSQVRESAAQLVRYAKQANVALLLVGHVTKEGTIAGPRVLEHMVDTVLYFEGERHGRFRLLRTVKNRFGAVNELGVFAMTDRGLREISNPSAIFLSQHTEPISGSAVMVSWEGSRPLLLEIQALVTNNQLGNPKRVTVGVDHNRLAMLLAVLHRHGGIASYDQDVFVNVVGGIKLLETSADLAVLCAIVSSLRNRPLSTELIVFGEVGLAGEIRPVPNGQERLQEAAKHGFKRAIVPQANAPKKEIKGLEVIPVKKIVTALEHI